MKKGRIFTNCVAAILTLTVLFSFAACSADSDTSIDNKIVSAPTNTTEAPFSVVVKALSDGEDVTTKGDVKSATLYVFDENNDFCQQINLDKSILLQRKSVQIGCPGAKKITVIAWAGLSSESEEISTMSQANIITDLQIQLKQNNGVASNASDLFYGQVTLQRPTTKAENTETLSVSRKVSSLSLSTKGVNKRYGTTDGSYFYKIKKTKSSFNHNGELTGADVEYVFPAYFNENGELVATTTPIFPASDLSIELYRDNELIFSSENTKNRQKVPAIEGKQVNVVFNFSASTSDISVSDWGTVIQYVTVG